jgi:hypothetical protein
MDYFRTALNLALAVKYGISMQDIFHILSEAERLIS